MPPTIGTYGSTIAPQYPSYLLPEPGDNISWDWKDMVGQFTQRFLRIATVCATVANDATYSFDYSALRCDYFPPVLDAMYFIGVDATYGTRWGKILNGKDGASDSFLVTEYPDGVWEFIGVGLGTAQFVNRTGTARAWQLIAYM